VYNEVFRLEKISARLDESIVIRNISFAINESEVCALIGENGAGKSTSMRILAGVLPSSSGHIYMEGQQVAISSISDAQKLGIKMLFHEPKLFNEFTVEYNIFAGHELCHTGTIIVKRASQRQRAQEVLSLLGCNFGPDDIVATLSSAQKRMVEIAKAIVTPTKLIILDEITSQFADRDVQLVFNTIRRLKEMHIAVIFISHKLEEVLHIADRIVILRGGEVAHIVENLGLQVDQLIEKMAGSDIINRYPKTRASKGERVLVAENISNSDGTVRNASLYLRRGEIVGVAGFHDSGKAELTRLLAGIDPISSGRITVDGQDTCMKKPYKALALGIAYLSEENAKNVHLLMNAHYNITLANLKKAEKLFLIRKRLILNAVQYYIKRLHIVMQNALLPSRYLSRGTQQKIAISKMLYADAQVLIMNEPATSLDSSSKVELYNIINRLAQKGKSILFSSSDLRELIGMCDRIYVVNNGEIVADLDAQKTSSKELLLFASGKQ
jgi:ABC-type sugar transport system ATPase subunit